MDKSFSKIIKVREMWEEYLMNGSIISLEFLKTSQSGGTLENKKKKIGAVIVT